MVDFLIRHSADMDASDSNGNNALHLMVIHSRPDVFSFIKARWEAANAARAGPDRVHGEKVLWKRRNHDGFTPMTLAAKEGNLAMFDYLLEQEKQMQWSYGPISCFVYPLDQIDMPLRPTAMEKAHTKKLAVTAAATAAAAASAAAMDGVADDSGAASAAAAAAARVQELEEEEEEEEDGSASPRALELIVNEAHLDLLMHPRVIELVKQKWGRFASRIFFQRFILVLLYLLLFSLTTVHRQTENVEGVARWARFEASLGAFREHSAAVRAMQAERETTLAKAHNQARQLYVKRMAEYEEAVATATAMATQSQSADGGSGNSNGTGGSGLMTNRKAKVETRTATSAATATAVR